VSVTKRFISLSIISALLSISAFSASAMTTAERDEQLKNLDQMEKEWTKLKEQWEKELADREAKISDYREKMNIEPKIKEIGELAKDSAETLPDGIKAVLKRDTFEAAKAAFDMSMNFMKQHNLGDEIANVDELEKEYGEKIDKEERSIKTLKAAIKLANEMIADSQKTITTLYATPTIAKAPEWLANIIKAGQEAETRRKSRKDAEAQASATHGGSGPDDRPHPGLPSGKGQVTPPPSPPRPAPEHPTPTPHIDLPPQRPIDIRPKP